MDHWQVVSTETGKVVYEADELGWWEVETEFLRVSPGDMQNIGGRLNPVERVDVRQYTKRKEVA